jgi:hypothetical protein
MTFSLTYPIQPSTCLLLQASKSSNLKGTRKLQFGFGSTGTQFTGGIISGTATGGGTATGKGTSTTADATTVLTPPPLLAMGDATGSGNFTTTSSGSGFIDTSFGKAQGSAGGGGTGSQAGKAEIVLGGVGTLEFDGTTTSSGTGGFGAGFSPVNFYSVTTEVPGAACCLYNQKSGKKGGTPTGFAPSTFTTVVTPVSTGPTGGFGSGSGSSDISSTTEGALTDNVLDGGGLPAPENDGDGFSGGKATNFGEGSASVANFFGSAGGAGKGAGTSEASGTGSTTLDPTGGIFSSSGLVDGSFSNQGSGLFGTTGKLSFFP